MVGWYRLCSRRSSVNRLVRRLFWLLFMGNVLFSIGCNILGRWCQKFMIGWQNSGKLSRLMIFWLVRLLFLGLLLLLAVRLLGWFVKNCVRRVRRCWRTLFRLRLVKLVIILTRRNVNLIGFKVRWLMYRRRLVYWRLLILSKLRCMVFMAWKIRRHRLRRINDLIDGPFVWRVIIDFLWVMPWWFVADFGSRYWC